MAEGTIAWLGFRAIEGIDVVSLLTHDDVDMRGRGPDPGVSGIEPGPADRGSTKTDVAPAFFDLVKERIELANQGGQLRNALLEDEIGSRWHATKRRGISQVIQGSLPRLGHSDGGHVMSKLVQGVEECALVAT